MINLKYILQLKVAQKDATSEKLHIIMQQRNMQPNINLTNYAIYAKLTISHKGGNEVRNQINHCTILLVLPASLSGIIHEIKLPREESAYF